MSTVGAGRRGWPIFARTFLLLLGALAVAYAVGVVPLALRKPPPAVRLSEVVALLSSRMPSDNPLLRVREVESPPLPEAGAASPPPLRTLLAEWLDVPEDQVRFYVTGPDRMLPLRRGDGMAMELDPLAWIVPSAMAQGMPMQGAPMQRAQFQGAPTQGPMMMERRMRALPAQRAGQLRYREPFQTQGDWRLPDRVRRSADTTSHEPEQAQATAVEEPVTADVDTPWPSRPAPDPATSYLRQYLPPYARIAPSTPAAPIASETATAPVEPVVALASAPRTARTREPEAAVRVGEPQSLAEPQIVLQEPRWRADSVLPFAFVAAARQADGHWRVVERPHTGPGMGQTFALMFGIGVVVLLPLAWWFSRALAGPIRRFAVAADHMGQDAAAPPVPLEGPAEIVRAAASFNAMQARINRLVRERTQMVAAIAHDLRTPLARLSFRLDQLPADAREKAAADIAEMSQMIETALGFIREQHRSGVRERLDLRLLVESVVDEHADVGHEVSCESGDAALLQGDPLALRRMVGNLVDNALKYGQRARLRLQCDGDDYVLHVDDDGPGVDPARSDQLFMPFVRGETSRNRETGGIGLGLATARSIVLAHGGDIALQNRPEGGLRVCVTLPRGVATQRPSPRLARS